MNTCPDHPDFTALALGEHIHGSPARAVLDALRTSVAARSEAEQIRVTAEQLSFALKAQPSLRLDAARRNAIFSADPAVMRALFAAEDAAAENDESEQPSVRAPRRLVHPGIAAAAVVAVIVWITQWLPGQKSDQRPAASVPDTGPDPQIMVQQPASPGRGKSLVVPPPSIAGVDEGPVLPGKGSEFPAPDAPPSLVEKAPLKVPAAPQTGSNTPPSAVNPPQPADPRYFDFATPIAPKKKSPR